MITPAANDVNVRGLKPTPMLNNEIKHVRTWYERINKKVPCKVVSIHASPDSIAIKLEAINEAEQGALLIEVEMQTGVEAEWHPFTAEAAFCFDYEGVEMEVQV